MKFRKQHGIPENVIEWYLEVSDDEVVLSANGIKLLSIDTIDFVVQRYAVDSTKLTINRLPVNMMRTLLSHSLLPYSVMYQLKIDADRSDLEEE